MPSTSWHLPLSCPVLYTKEAEGCEDTLPVLWTKRSSTKILNVPGTAKEKNQTPTGSNYSGYPQESQPWLGWPRPYTPTLTSSFMVSRSPLNDPRTPGVSIYMHWIQSHMEHYEKYMRGSLVTHHQLWVLKFTVPEVSFISISSLPWSSLWDQRDQDWSPYSAPLISHNWMGWAWKPLLLGCGVRDLAGGLSLAKEWTRVDDIGPERPYTVSLVEEGYY